MDQPLTKAQARNFRARWARVNAAEVVELRRASLAQRFEQLASLMASANMFDWPKGLKQETDQVRARWRRLREAYAR